ncbi:MAG: DUF1549 domain-containing protein [Verrucomicrobiota bacterium]
MPQPVRFLLSAIAVAAVAIALVVGFSVGLQPAEDGALATSAQNSQLVADIALVDASISDAWRAADLSPTPQADRLTLARRLSLALTGAGPSVEELKRLERLSPEVDPIQSWLDHLLADDRFANYYASRLSRVYVGAAEGPFLVFRRRRLNNWLAEQLKENRPYDEIVSEMISADGVWTTNPAANFVTATFVGEGDNQGPDELALATRTSRAFLGVSLDCMQCHDDKFGDYWKQEHFHEFAAFYGQAEIQLTGLRDKPDQLYETQYLGAKESSVVTAAVPFLKELDPGKGPLRDRLAKWITHTDNRPFARTIVNRTWAMLLGRPHWRTSWPPT